MLKCEAYLLFYTACNSDITTIGDKTKAGLEINKVECESACNSDVTAFEDKTNAGPAIVEVECKGEGVGGERITGCLKKVYQKEFDDTTGQIEPTVDMDQDSENVIPNMSDPFILKKKRSKKEGKTGSYKIAKE